jgi:hypothetical protein
MEWQQVSPATDPRLRGYSLGPDSALQSLAHGLREQVDIREGREGLEVTSTSAPPAASMKHGTLDARRTRRLASRRPSARRIGRLVFAAAAQY